MDGFTAYIDGTAYDVLNSMSFNFVVDIARVSGSGSKTYNYPGFTLTAALINGSATVGSTEKRGTVSVSGQVVNWSGIEGSDAKICVCATAISTANYEGFVLNDYTTSPPTFKIAPAFTPFNLVQVIDITPGYGQLYQTKVPASLPFIAFHRSLAGSGYDHVIWTETTSNGYWALRFRSSEPGAIAMTATRIYVFSKMMVNIPPGGFFMYDNGQIVWHSNCLPLSMSVGGIENSGEPVATTSGMSVIVHYPWDPMFPFQGQARYNCYSAGRDSNGRYSATAADIFKAVNYSNPSTSGRPPGVSLGPPGAIVTTAYDTYYKLALGL